MLSQRHGCRSRIASIRALPLLSHSIDVRYANRSDRLDVVCVGIERRLFTGTINPTAFLVNTLYIEAYVLPWVVVEHHLKMRIVPMSHLSSIQIIYIFMHVCEIVCAYMRVYSCVCVCVRMSVYD